MERAKNSRQLTENDAGEEASPAGQSSPRSCGLKTLRRENGGLTVSSENSNLMITSPEANKA